MTDKLVPIQARTIICNGCGSPLLLDPRYAAALTPFGMYEYVCQCGNIYRKRAKVTTLD